MRCVLHRNCALHASQSQSSPAQPKRNRKFEALPQPGVLLFFHLWPLAVPATANHSKLAKPLVYLEPKPKEILTREYAAVLREHHLGVRWHHVPLHPWQENRILFNFEEKQTPSWHQIQLQRNWRRWQRSELLRNRINCYLQLLFMFPRLN